MKYKRRLLVLVTTFASAIYIIWRITQTMPFGFGWFAWFCAIFLIAVEILGFVEMVVHFYQLSSPLKLGDVPLIADEEYPHVDIFISTYNEPEDLLFKTINGCLNMTYPDLNKVHIYLCDDGDRPQMKVLADRMGINYLNRDTHEHAKAGNLNAAIDRTTSPYIVTFDADMIPRRQFLMRTMPFFVVDNNIGFIQTPQTFYNPDLFQYNLYAEKLTPSEQDYFYRDVQIMRNKSNSVIYGGTNTILSRQALADAGYFFTGVITEDFATGINIQSKGYQCYAIDEPLAVGMAPEDLKSLINQRKRWARGCIQTGKKVNILFKKGLSLAQKASYMTSITYWFGPLKEFAYVLAPLLYALFNVIIVKTNLLEVLIFWLPMYLLNNYTLKKLSGNIRSTSITYIYDTIMFPSLLPAVILETLGISQTTFQVTQKDGKQKAGSENTAFRRKTIMPHLILAIASAIGIAIAIHQTFATQSEAYVMILFWLSINLYNLTMAVLFMIGRPAKRKFERFVAEVDCLITFENQVIRAKTYDIAEEGLSFRLDYPEWLPNDEDVIIQVKTAYYETTLTGKVKNVFQNGHQWQYGLYIQPVSPKAASEWMQIIYDREHTLPKFIGNDYSSLNALAVNLRSHMVKDAYYSRSLPRISVDDRIQTDLGQELYLHDFNYQFVTLDAMGKMALPEQTTLLVGGLEIHCQLINEQTNQVGVYQITNTKDLIANPMLRPIVSTWIECNQQESIEADELTHVMQDYFVEREQLY